jgi:hypothetical protein
MSEPFEISAGDRKKSDGRPLAGGAASGRGSSLMRLISAVALSLAVSTALILITIRSIRYVHPTLVPWNLKSAVPLILIGVAFGALQFALPRTRAQVVLGLMVAAAFILWGAEQFVADPALAALIDDIVVFLFVLDLGIVIGGHLKPGAQPAAKGLQ